MKNKTGYYTRYIILNSCTLFEAKEKNNNCYNYWFESIKILIGPFICLKEKN